ncbi:potassium channel subfamily K member 18 [Cydia fagiglandana]|uniref:potassium channel subfamily K member 18 n=1 Tax=Cydia fagiglandana TaxID=1458189 RepID=UPI002FEE022F
MPRRRRRLASRLRDYLRNFLAFLFSNVGVVVLVVAYTVAGAFMFRAIEGASEMERAHNMTLERDNTAQCLWQDVLKVNIFNDTYLKHRISITIQQYQDKVVHAVKRGWDGGRSSRQWSFSSSFLYSLTVITTIGYGHLSPRTSWGKVTTIMYTLLGMPLFLLYLANVGELLARWFKCIYALVCLCRGCPGFTRRRVIRLRQQLELSDAESIECPEHWRRRAPFIYESDDTADYGPPIPHPYNFARRPDYLRSASMPVRGAPRAPQPRRWSEPPESVTSDFSYVTFDAQTITVPISVCVAIMVGYIMFGSMIFGMWEKWDQLDGAYFCFISLSSIGFGDFVPGERVYTQRIETSFIVCSMYLMLGMALVAIDLLHRVLHVPHAGHGSSRHVLQSHAGTVITFVPGERVYTQRIETSFIVCSMYLMLGMTLVAMCFNLMQEQVRHYFAGMKRALRRICRCKR